MSSRPEYLLLIEHTKVAPHIFDDIRAIGLKVLYLGEEKDLQERADRFIDLNPLTELENLIEHRLGELREAGVVGVLTLSEHQKFAEQRVAAALGFPTLPPPVLQLGRDKHEMRRHMRQAGISVPDFSFIPDDAKAPKAPLPFPFIVKPNLGFSSAGVQLVRDHKSFEAGLRTIRRLNQFALRRMADAVPGTLCEEFIDGPEFSVDSITVGGRTRSFTICGRDFPGEDNFQDYVYFTPPRISPDQQRELEEDVARLLEAFGYLNGPTHIEARFDRMRGRWMILEVAYRVGFGGNIGLVCRAVTGLNYNQLAIRAALGMLSYEELERSFRQPARHAVLFTPGTGKGGIVSGVGGAELLTSDPRIVGHRLLKGKGEAVIPYPKGLEYLGYVLGVAESQEDLDKLIHEIAEEVVYEYEEN